MHRVNRALRLGLSTSCLCAPFFVNTSVSHADPPPPNKATVTIIAPGASELPNPHPPSNRLFTNYFKSSNKVVRYDFAPNAYVTGVAEFSIECEGAVDPDMPSSWFVYVPVVTRASSTGVYDPDSLIARGSKPLYNNRQYSATFKADFTLNGSLLTDTKTVSFSTGDSQPVNPDGPNN